MELARFCTHILHHIVTTHDNADIGNGAAQQQAQEQPEARGRHAAPGGAAAGSPDAKALESQLAERDSRIEELEAKVAEVAKNAETADELRAEIASLKEQSADERVEFGLMLAGCRNVKAAKAVLADHGGDVEALKAAEPWMFQDAPAKQSGKTGLSNAGAANDADKQMGHWREVAGLADDE